MYTLYRVDGDPKVVVREWQGWQGWPVVCPGVCRAPGLYPPTPGDRSRGQGGETKPNPVRRPVGRDHTTDGTPVLQYMSGGVARCTQRDS